jgi:hypothetical protein
MASITKDEPVLIGSLVAAAVGWVLSFLVTQGIITDTQASSLTQTVVPIATAALTTLLGLLLRHFVSPAAKVVDVLEREHLLTDADWGRIEGLLHTYIGWPTDEADDEGPNESEQEFPPAEHAVDVKAPPVVTEEMLRTNSPVNPPEPMHAGEPTK